MNWKDMTMQQKDRFIAEAIFGYEIHLDYGILVSDADGMRRIEAIPPYSTDMSAAWLVFKRMMERYREPDIAWRDGSDGVFRLFAETLMGDLSCDYASEIYPGFMIFHEIAQWTPDFLCFAACRACGILDRQTPQEVENEFSTKRRRLCSHLLPVRSMWRGLVL